MGTKNALKKQIQKTHTTCRRCGRTSFHIQKKVCSACGYPSARMRSYNWGKKMIRRKNEGTGRMQYMKTLPRKFKNGFREGVRRCPPSAPSAASPGGFSLAWRGALLLLCGGCGGRQLSSDGRSLHSVGVRRGTLWLWRRGAGARLSGGCRCSCRDAAKVVPVGGAWCSKSCAASVDDAADALVGGRRQRSCAGRTRFNAQRRPWLRSLPLQGQGCPSGWQLGWMVPGRGSASLRPNRLSLTTPVPVSCADHRAEPQEGRRRVSETLLVAR